jgi:excisionase family DNA binding protein
VIRSELPLGAAATAASTSAAPSLPMGASFAGALQVFVDMVAARVVEKLAPMLAEPSAAPPPRPLLTKSELANALRVSTATVDRRLREKRIPFVPVGDVKRFDLEAVRAALPEVPASAPAAAPVQGSLSGVRLLSRRGTRK